MKRRKGRRPSGPHWRRRPKLTGWHLSDPLKRKPRQRDRTPLRKQPRPANWRVALQSRDSFERLERRPDVGRWPTLKRRRGLQLWRQRERPLMLQPGQRKRRQMQKTKLDASRSKRQNSLETERTAFDEKAKLDKLALERSFEKRVEAIRQAAAAEVSQASEAEALLARRLREEKERAEAERSALEEKAKADRLALERSFEEKAEAARQDAAAKAAQASELARRASVSGFFRAAGAEEARRRLLADAEEKARLTALEAENKIARVEAATEDKVRRAMEEAARVLEEEEARRRAVEEAERARRREAEIKAALEGVLEQIWSKNWAEVQLWGNGAGSWSTGSIYKFKTPAELDECKGGHRQDGIELPADFH